MCMGFGCSAVGVTGCRIIDSKRERMIAMLTNCIVPCNGKFPTLVVMSSIMMISLGIRNSLFSALFLMSMVLLSIAMTWILSYVLSNTILKGEPSAFTLELPAYRRPQFIKVLVHSFLERTMFVLGRAVVTAIPAGILVWGANHIIWNGTSLMYHMVQWCEPLGRAMGLDGVIVVAFLFGFPANEIIMPIMLMIYSQAGVLFSMDQITNIHQIVLEAGWSRKTVVCMCIFLLFHWPCSTTLLTIKKETNSIKWTMLALLLPTVVGIVLCCFVNAVAMIY